MQMSKHSITKCITSMQFLTDTTKPPSKIAELIYTSTSSVRVPIPLTLYIT